MNRGDYSRITHKPSKHYTGVIKQQGRVDLDADSYEDVEIAAYLRQTQTQDVVGPCGFPKPGRSIDYWSPPEVGGGFEITPIFRIRGGSIDVVDLAISPGRGYVDGTLCELEAEAVGISVDSRNNAVVHLDILRLDNRELQKGQWVEVFSQEVKTPVFARITEVNVGDPISLTLDVSLDRRFQGDIPVFLRRVTTYTTQPDYPDPPPLNLGPNVSRTDAVYLDVWQRHITAIEDPDIREVALGGPDTTTRVKTVWQVKVQQNTGLTSCEGGLPRLPNDPSGGRLSTGVVPTPAAEDPCLIAPDGDYRGLENRLYRVEIHQGGNLAAPDNLQPAKFKWSRDNGSVVFPIEGFVEANSTTNTTKVRVKRLGRDQVLRLHTGDWVEVLDDATEYRQDHTQDGKRAGTMAQVDSIDEEERLLTLKVYIPPNTYNVARHARIRRWDQKQNVDASGLMTVAEGSISLEDGIQVRFSGGNFKVGDHWSFAARTATSDHTAAGDVERLTNAPPQGIKHHYCRLALIDWHIDIRNPNAQIIDVSAKDCRPIFPPLTEITAKDVSFDDKVCKLGADNVQGALDSLCERTTPIKWPTVVSIGWDNDQPIPLTKFNQGLRVAFSEPVKAPSLETLRTLFIVTLELPEQILTEEEEEPPAGYRPFIVHGTLNFLRTPVRETWEFVPQPKIGRNILNTWLSLEKRLFGRFDQPRGIRCRVVLKGNAILSEKDERPLDGDVFGQLRRDRTTNLILPSGDGNRGGDFESWFWLVGDPVTLNLTLDPATVRAGNRSTGTITLSDPAPQGGTQVNLSSDPPALAPVPPSITIPEKQITTTFNVNTVANEAGPGETKVNITASFTGASVTAPLKVVAAPRPPIPVD